MPCVAHELRCAVGELDADVERFLAEEVTEQGCGLRGEQKDTLLVGVDVEVVVLHQHLSVAADHVKSVLLEVEAYGIEHGAHRSLFGEWRGACDVLPFIIFDRP